MIKLKFTKTEFEYGSIKLVDSAIERLGWTFPVEHHFQIPGHFPDPTRMIHLLHASKAIGHSEWRNGWFRPDLWGWHLKRVTDGLHTPFAILGEQKSSCTIRVEDEEFSCRCKPEDRTAHRLLYLSALAELNITNE